MGGQEINKDRLDLYLTDLLPCIHLQPNHSRRWPLSQAPQRLSKAKKSPERLTSRFTDDTKASRNGRRVDNVHRAYSHESVKSHIPAIRNLLVGSLDSSSIYGVQEHSLHDNIRAGV